MKFALQILPNGESHMVDTTGTPLGQCDTEHPILHILPKLFVPVEVLRHPSQPYWGLQCDEISLKVTTSLPIDVQPESGIEIRQPYPNKRYFVGGSNLIRNGWTVSLPPSITEFDIEFHWHIDSPSIWHMVNNDDWQVRHLLHIKLHPGKGMTYSMDASCWPCKERAMWCSPITIFGIDGVDIIDRNRRQIIKESNLVYTDKELNGQVTGYYLEEKVEITGIPLEQAWSINAFQDRQLHEENQTSILIQDIESHRANGPIEMPADLFIQAVKLAEEIPFDKDSYFAQSVTNIAGGMETHPAMKLLCDWWDKTRPEGEPFKPGSAMPMVRIQDDGEYWWGHYEIPNVQVEGFNPRGRDIARIGDLMLVMFQATQDNAIFDKHGMTVVLPSGEPYNTVGINKEQYITGDWDEAWFCLNALSSFRSRFPVAWDFLLNQSSEK